MTSDIVEKANQLWYEGKEDDAIALLSPLVESDNLLAKSSLGLIYCHYFKNDTFLKIEEGEKLLAEACESGEPSACHNLGTLWLGNSPAIGNDRRKAAYYYLRAKELGGQVADDKFYERWEQELNG